VDGVENGSMNQLDLLQQLLQAQVEYEKELEKDKWLFLFWNSSWVYRVVSISINISKRTKQKPKDVYACPMKCEGNKTYDKPGSCPVCGMDLVKLLIIKPTVIQQR
jgi:hypothetical protein